MSMPLFWNADGLPMGTHFVGRFSALRHSLKQHDHWLTAAWRRWPEIPDAGHVWDGTDQGEKKLVLPGRIQCNRCHVR